MHSPSPKDAQRKINVLKNVFLCLLDETFMWGASISGVICRILAGELPGCEQ